ncbi:putative rhoptry neck protein [Besnoitia besnoiti]|uniref:Putative rhoptry neck protein n=1 Tax=Besnoitia besnoiti TaxID=94643 RepID=A0A2A9MM84_BESBE|nr:putative rhoptry neck protein [Besnoitia besnoiti]PFH36650.1 putative rhoptry neck protein [Besnoitia besnoiti]
MGFVGALALPSTAVTAKTQLLWAVLLICVCFLLDVSSARKQWLDSSYALSPDGGRAQLHFSTFSGNSLVDISSHGLRDSTVEARRPAPLTGSAASDVETNGTVNAAPFAPRATSAQDYPPPDLSEQELDKLLLLDADPAYQSPSPNLVDEVTHSVKKLMNEPAEALPGVQPKPFVTDHERLAMLSNNLKELRTMLEDPDLEKAVNGILALLPVLEYGESSEAHTSSVDSLEAWSDLQVPAMPSSSAEQFSSADDRMPQEISAAAVEQQEMRNNLAFLSLSLAGSSSIVDEEPLEKTRTRLTEKLKRVAGMALGFEQFGIHQTATGSGVSIDETASGASVDSGPVEDSSEMVPLAGLTAGRVTGLATTKGASIPHVVGLIATSNPFLLTHLLLLGAAFLGYDRYFGDGTPTLLPFYGTQTLLSMLSPLDTPARLDSMAAANREPRKRYVISRLSRKKNITYSFDLASSSWDRKRSSRLPLGSHRLILDVLDRHLEALTTYAEQQIEILRQAGIPVEASIPIADNLARLHVSSCRSTNNAIAIPCAWKDTLLVETLSSSGDAGENDDGARRTHLKISKLENAFNTVTGLGSLAAKRENTASAKILKRYGLSHLLDLANQRQASSTPLWDKSDISRKLEAFHDYKTALRVRLHIMALLPQWNPYREEYLSPIEFVREAFDGETGSMILAARLKPLMTDDLVHLGVPKGFSFLWLFEFLIDDDSPNARVTRSQAVKRSARWTKILYSHRQAIPLLFRRFYKTLKTGVLAKMRRKSLERSKLLLRQHLPDDWQDIVVSAFTFTAHSAALMQVVNYHSLFRDQALDDLQESTYLSAPPSFSVQSQSAVKRCDHRIYEWSRFGFSPDVLEADLHNETFKGKWNKIRLETMPTPDTHQWWRRLHRSVVDSLEKYRAHEGHLEGMNDNLYTLVMDTTQRLTEEGAADSTIFFGRSARGARESRFKRVKRGMKSFVLDIVRDVPESDHAVWFGVTFGFPSILRVLRKMKEIAVGATDDKDVSIPLDEAFMELVQETIAVRTESFRRQPPTALRNIGVIGLRPDYGNLGFERRSEEYQLSMCADHCAALWRQILGFVYPFVLDPSLLTDYERSFGTDHAVKQLDNPSYVNSFRYIFASDAALNFLEYSTPSETRKALMALKDGQAFMYANMMRFAGMAYGNLNMPYLAGSLQRQAPFMGQMVKDWLVKRSRARKFALQSVVSLGLIFVYTLLSALDIARHLTDIGMEAVEDCHWNPIMQELACLPVAGGGAVAVPLFTAMSDVFKVGLYSGIGSTIISATVIGNVYMIVRSESRLLLRMEMAIKELALKLWKKLRKFFSWATRFTKRRKAILSTMMARASALSKKSGAYRKTARVLEVSGDTVVDTLLEGMPSYTTQGVQSLMAPAISHT